MLLLFQRLFGKRDLLIPYVDFTTIPPNPHASPLLSRIYRLRYQVYCLECRFLDAAAYPDGIESDTWDADSAHVAANSLDGDLIGTVRLVRPQPGQAFPFEAQCPVYEDVVLPPRGESAEVSRLIVEKAFRRRSGDAMEGVSSDVVKNRHSSGRRRFSRGKSDRRNSPLLLLGMYRAMYRYSVANGIRYWYAAMESSLARSLDRMGMPLLPIGPEGDYYGPVTVHMVDLRDLEQRVGAENPFLLAWFKGEPIPFRMMAKTVAGAALRGFQPRKLSLK
ncbi:PEP-CTERM/exosortase system-associated acyltransferase [Massilia sp. CCM 8695]|uniref:PEP-CTERM/exosortase system-associated acyltransferase n=1 Tax=Massilia frigida TaxID=2609281 RepID=A0ABX0NJK5_9BURK|nr:PEP-CTERM/exosortase system-associated acyltransferase [Massilia frigida]NHZ83255.1 PEP-CTERM/exosortase system-associated acyltransferase [Massilia frigida]